MVIDLNQPVTVSDALVLPPSAGFGYRVVIDLFPTTRTKFDAQAGWPADLKKRESDAEKLAALIAAQQAPRRRRQEGHRARSRPWRPRFRHQSASTGLMEKDLVLAEGLQAGARLLQGARLYRAS